MTAQILIVDDDEALSALLAAALARRGFDTHAEPDPTRALEWLRRHPADAALTDVRLPAMTGIEFCTRVREIVPDLPVLVMTAFASLDGVLEAMRAGAIDYLIKPLQFDLVAARLTRVLEETSLRREVVRLRRMLTEPDAYEGLVGTSPAMRAVHATIERLAESEASVLVTGESGVGKEVVARVLHGRSRRASGPFVPVNCAAIPENLLESELFGHVKGAFTDARTDRRGLFAQAAGGTLFLDEIGEMPPSLQPKILRAIEDRRVRPVGGAEEMPVDFRLVTATHRDLESAIVDGGFREDLFYRINVVRIDVPPLRGRGRDILLLAQRLLEHAASAARKPVSGISPTAAERLLAYPWPGNVRELRNSIEHAVALTTFDQLTVEDLPQRVREYRPSHVLVAGTDPGELVTMDEVEARYIARVLDAVGGNKSAAAKVLGFDRRTLYRKLERYGAGAPSAPPGRVVAPATA